MSLIANIKNQIKVAEENIYNLYIRLQKAEARASISLPIGTKFKWIEAGNPETYRVAIQTKDGVLQVKSVTNGGGDCDNRGKLKLTHFADEYEWRNTIDEANGTLTITPPRITNKALKDLCMKPLASTEDALILKELEERFLDGVFVLSVPKKQYVISYKLVANTYHQIYSDSINMSFFHFSDYGSGSKPQLMVEWRGLYIDLSHLF